MNAKVEISQFSFQQWSLLNFCIATQQLRLQYSSCQCGVMKVSAGGVKSQPYSSWKSVQDSENQTYAAAFRMLESLLTVVAPGMVIYLGRLQVSELSEWLNKWNMTESMLSPSCRITYSCELVQKMRKTLQDSSKLPWNYLPPHC